MSDLTNATYAEIQKGLNGIKTYLKLSRWDVYAFTKLAQFIGRGLKEKFFTQNYVENFGKFIKESKGDFEMFRMPYKENKLWLDAKGTIQKYLDKAGIKYCIQDTVNEADKAVHVCVQRRDVQKFNACFNQYIRDNLTGGELSKQDLLNFTDGKTSIISIPDAAAGDMEHAFKTLDVNFSGLPDLMPNDGEKQYRIAAADLNTAQQAYNVYKHKLLADSEGEKTDIPDMKVISEQQYLDTAHETPEQWMESASAEIKEKLAAYDQLTPEDKEKEIMSFSKEIKPASSYECAVYKRNDEYLMISIDYETLVKDNPINANLAGSELLSDHIACFIPGTQRRHVLYLKKSQVFKVEGEGKIRYLAFIKKEAAPPIFINNKPDFSHQFYKNGQELYKKFDLHSKRNNPVQNMNMVQGISPQIKSPKIK